jgi:hypothetical protein
VLLNVAATACVLALAMALSTVDQTRERHLAIAQAISQGRADLSYDVTAAQARAIQSRLYDTYIRYLPYRDDPDMRELRTLLGQANHTVEAKEAGRAHRQHGHEGPGGTLGPGDIER